MKQNMLIVTSLLMLSFSGQVAADEGKGDIGMKLKVISLSYTNASGYESSLDWGGLAITGEYDVLNYLAVSASYYPSLTEELDLDSVMSGFEVSAKVGPNKRGFTYFGDFGYFNDSYEHKLNNRPSAKLSGFSIGTGVGYNWKHVGLIVNIFKFRTTDDYKKIISNASAVVTVSAGATYRF